MPGSLIVSGKRVGDKGLKSRRRAYALDRFAAACNNLAMSGIRICRANHLQRASDILSGPLENLSRAETGAPTTPA